MAIELLAEFEPFLSQHTTHYGNGGSGITSDLSSTTYEKLIILMKQKVIKEIKTEIQPAKYFSISVNSTPDLSHIDQLTFIIRDVK